MAYILTSIICAILFFGYRQLQKLQQMKYSINFVFKISIIYYILIFFQMMLYFSRNIKIILILQILLSIVYIIFSRRKIKVKLKITKRIVRLIITNVILIVGFVILHKNVVNYYLILSIIPIVQLIFFCISICINFPLEIVVSKYYIKKAKNKIKKCKNLIVIGITGSYGKTSTKKYLETILSEKYRVLSTPKSYNTPNGIALTINKYLNNSYEIFIVEMGAVKIGEISELCKFVNPQYGIITSIGPQHINTFKNIENVAKTKFELFEYLNNNNIFFNKNILKYNSKLHKQYLNVNVINYINNDINIIKTNNNKIDIDNNFEYKNKKYTTHVLGKKLVENICLCIDMALKLGLSENEIYAGVNKITPTESRLEPIVLKNGLIIINDSFNANINSVQNALEVLSIFKKRKVIVTPGLIDCGRYAYKYNHKFGQMIAKCCDLVYIVNDENKTAIYDGLKSQNFENSNIYFYKSFDLFVKTELEKFGDNDVLLIENDLPDVFK